MKFFSFIDEQETLDPALQMQLLDLARALSDEPRMEVTLRPISVLDAARQQIALSSLWNELLPESLRLTGFKSDLYLRTIGSWQHTDRLAVRQVYQTSSRSPRLYRQLFALLEDHRLMKLCLQQRPGTRRIFAERLQALIPYYLGRYASHEQLGERADAWLLSVYLRLYDESLLADFSLTSILQTNLLAATSSWDIVHIAQTLLADSFTDHEGDTVATYFDVHLDGGRLSSTRDEVSKLERANRIENSSALDSTEESAEEREIQTSVWHRETQEKTANMMQMNVEHGNHVKAKSDQFREGMEFEVDSMEVVQGNSGGTNRNQNEVDSTPPSGRNGASKGLDQHGQHGAASRASAFREEPVRPVRDRDYREYLLLKQSVWPSVRKLENLIRKTALHKVNSQRENLHFGRLSKKLHRILIEKSLRLFYKKQSPSPEFDIVFELLVDCSGSMYDRLDEAKKAVCLFHETLLRLNIAHRVTGFWEESEVGVGKEAETVFQSVIHYEGQSGRDDSPRICHLEPELDNRDGFAIRHITRRLTQRTERTKFLIVFSDGEPAAENYEHSGVLDTHRAVLEARRQQVQVFNIFFENPNESHMRPSGISKIYGSNALFIHDVSDIPERMAPLLKRLLLLAM